MIRLHALLILIFASSTFLVASDTAETPHIIGPLNFILPRSDGGELHLHDLHGKVILLVNTASQCGFTGQYAGLQKLYASYHAQGLIVIGVPSNDFGRQEPGTNETIVQFCSTTYGVTFPIVAKLPVSGDGIHPLYRWLTEKSPFPGAIGWNFTKFLIGRDGSVLSRWPSKVKPDDPQLTAAIRTALDAAAHE